MDESVILIVSTLAGALGIKEIWSIVKKRMDQTHSITENSQSYKEKRIEELENDLKESQATILALTVRVSKLEERILHTAKNRVKPHNTE